MVTSPRAVALPVDFHLSPGELSPMNDQAMFPVGEPPATVAEFDLEIEEQAFYQQDEERIWCLLGTWDM